MRLLIDMNLSPRWVPFLRNEGFQSEHWSDVGSPTAPDSIILEWAQENGYVVFTHDLDFSILVALIRVNGPSVVQIRSHNLLSDSIGDTVVGVIRKHADTIEAGAILTIDDNGARVRILPIR